MAANLTVIFFALIPSLLVACSYAHVSSDKYCVVCSRYCHMSDKPVRKIIVNADLMYDCFGVRTHDKVAGVICSTCRRAIDQHKASGSTFFHVSLACIFSRVEFYPALKLSTNSSIAMFTTAREVKCCEDKRPETASQRSQQSRS